MRRRRSLAARALLPALALLALLAAPLASTADEEGDGDAPPIYKWIDENGVAHYTTKLERVPAALRERAEPLGEEEGDAAASEVERGPSASDAASDEESWAVRDRRPQSAPDPWAEEIDAYADEPLRPVPQDAEAGGEEAASAPPGEAPEPAPEGPSRAERRAALDRRIAALREKLAQSEDQLKGLISGPGAADEPAGFDADSPLRSEARSVARIMEDLAALEKEREEIAAPETAESP